jgi:hypothetical protein
MDAARCREVPLAVHGADAEPQTNRHANAIASENDTL